MKAKIVIGLLEKDIRRANEIKQTERYIKH